MTQLLIIADDITGALDSGVHFANKGIPTVVKVSRNFTPDPDAAVIVLDTETRHVAPELAYSIIHNLVVEASQHGVTHFFKKTDSVLRGRLGQEISALSDAVKGTVNFIPAYPSQGRTTKNGIQYVDGIPVHESIFGKDPFAPVTGKTIKEILNIKTLPVLSVQNAEQQKENERSILVYDAENDTDIENILCSLDNKDALHYMAGCAGLAKVLANVLPFEQSKTDIHINAADIFVICGSLNLTSKNQIDFACQHGFSRFELPEGAKFTHNFLQTAAGEEYFSHLAQVSKENSPVIVDVFDAEFCSECEQRNNAGVMSKSRELVAGELGALLHKWMQLDLDQIPVVIGGDTLLGFLNSYTSTELHPICELSDGAVLSEVIMDNTSKLIISKSGGLGYQDALVEMRTKLISTTEPM